MAKKPRYLIMDGRAFADVNEAMVFDTANTRKEVIRRAKPFGDIEQYEVAIVDNETNEIDRSFYRR